MLPGRQAPLTEARAIILESDPTVPSECRPKRRNDLDPACIYSNEPESVHSLRETSVVDMLAARGQSMNCHDGPTLSTLTTKSCAGGQAFAIVGPRWTYASTRIRWGCSSAGRAPQWH